tara:strand:+ start:720 stop:1724 length:1005 start_codon:yes stop_codon:yes gene_type:complete
MNQSYKNVLVTGGAGCIGIQVCNELISRGINVHIFDLPEQIARVKDSINQNGKVFYGSILDCSSLRDAMIDCDGVIHLAAYLGVRRTETNMLRCIEININGTKNVLDCAIQQKIKKIVFASSSEVYGEPLENPITEESITQGKTVYAVTKLSGEELCKAYSQRYPDISFAILRYFNTYGPHQIAQFVVPKFINNVLNNQSPIIYGDGRQKRSYCYSSDTARATVDSLISENTNGQTINIGNSNQPISLQELAELVIKTCSKEKDLEPVFQEDFSNTDREEGREIFERFCDTSKAKKLIEYSPLVDLETGIKNIIEDGPLSKKWESTDLDYSMNE